MPAVSNYPFPSGFRRKGAIKAPDERLNLRIVRRDLLKMRGKHKAVQCGFAVARPRRVTLTCPGLVLGLDDLVGALETGGGHAYP
jgi:hypothetical protein